MKGVSDVLSVKEKIMCHSLMWFDGFEVQFNNDQIILSECDFIFDGRTQKMESVYFEIPSENENVVYDLYLTESNGVFLYELEKFYFDENTFPHYSGTNKLIHNLINVYYPKDSKPEITINKIIKNTEIIEVDKINEIPFPKNNKK